MTVENMKRVLLAASAVVLLVFALEVLLRFYAPYIPFDLVRHFDAGLRQEIAFERDPLDGADDRAIERDDGGPPLRIFGPRRYVTKGYGYDGTTAGVTTDGMGFCNPPDQSYDRERIDIVAIGDSLTWCTSVKPTEAWPALLAGRLGKSVYNLGVPGIGAYEYLVLLRRFGLAKRPRIVVMNLYEGNDPRDALRYWRHREQAAATSDPDLSGAFPGVLARASYAYNLLAAAWTELTHAKQPAWGEGQGPLMWNGGPVERGDLNFKYRLKQGTTSLAFNTRNADRDELLHAIALDRGLFELGVFDQALAEFVRLGRAHCFVPLVIYTPSAYTAYDAFVEFEDAAAGPVLRRYSDKQRAYFAAAAERFGYRFLDLTAALREGAERGFDAAKVDDLMYYPSSVHLGAQGNEVVAAAVAAFLEDALPNTAVPDC